MLRPLTVVSWVGSLAAVTATAGQARGDEAPEVDLRYQVEASVVDCPDEATLRQEVVARLGRDPFRARAPALVSVTIAPEASTLVATVNAQGLAQASEGQRTLQAGRDECGELVSAIALGIAIAIDPRVLVRPAPPSPPVASPPPAPASPAVPAAPTHPTRPAHSSPAPPRPTPAIAVALGPVATYRDGPGLGAELDVRRSAQRHAEGLELRLTRDGDRAVGEGQVAVQLATGRAFSCLRLGAVAGCAVAEAGALGLRGRGFPAAREGTLAWFALGPRVEVEGAFAPGWGTRAFAELPISPWPIDLTLGPEVLGRLPCVGFALGLALFARFS